MTLRDYFAVARFLLRNALGAALLVGAIVAGYEVLVEIREQARLEREEFKDYTSKRAAFMADCQAAGRKGYECKAMWRAASEKGGA